MKKLRISTLIVSIVTTMSVFGQIDPNSNNEPCPVVFDLSTGLPVPTYYTPSWVEQTNLYYGILHTVADRCAPTRVGINTDNPQATLQISGSTYSTSSMGIGIEPNTESQLNIRSNLKEAGILLFNNYPSFIDGTGYGIKNIVNSDKIIAYSVTRDSDENDVFRVLGDGHVFAKEITVKLPPFPDYVFAKEYDLMSIKQLGDYIDKNKQLPNMPNAAEVKENGLGIGALQVKLVEKIEELTLYIIELEKRMSTLETKGGSR